MPRVEQVQKKALEEYRERNRSSAKRKKKNQNQTAETLITVVCVFFLLSLLFLHLVKYLTPRIDTSVGENSSEEVAEVQEDSKSSIDDRLKLIQFNDKLGNLNFINREKELFNEELEEPVVLPKNKRQEKVVEEETTIIRGKALEKVANEKDAPTTMLKIPETIQKVTTEQQPVQKTPTPVAPQQVAKQPVKLAPTPTKTNELDKRIDAINNSNVSVQRSANYKVLVGRYQTAEQAQVAKSILRETALGQNAFVKVVEGTYTIQVGSYTSIEQAKGIAQDLTTKSFPARVYYEKSTPAPTAPIPSAGTTGKNIF